MPSERGRLSVIVATIAIASFAGHFTVLAQRTVKKTRVGATPTPLGYFVLQDDNGPYPIPDWAYADPLVHGVSLRGGWGQLEPQEGQFNWFFDQDIQRARQSGKQVILRVYTAYRGKRMADWVYSAGAERFEFAEGGTQISMPVPWDPVLLKKWTNLVRVLGKKYDSEPSVVLVQMAGLDYTGGEMHLPKSPADKANWRRVGYTPDKLAAAWTSVIDAYSAAFPHKKLCLNVSTPIDLDGVVEQVMNYAMNKLGERFCIQHNALSAKTVEDGAPHKWVLAAKGKATIGFQQVCPATPNGKFNDDGRRYGGTLEQSLEIGRRAGMNYIEMYKPDIQNPEFRPVLEQFVRAAGSGKRTSRAPQKK